MLVDVQSVSGQRRDKVLNEKFDELAVFAAVFKLANPLRLLCLFKVLFYSLVTGLVRKKIGLVPLDYSL